MAPKITKNLAKLLQKLKTWKGISCINFLLLYDFTKLLKIWPFFHNCNWQHISKSSRLLPKIPAEMSKRLSLPTLDHFCGNLKHMFQVLEEQERKKIEQQQAADSHLESHVIHQYQSQIFLRLFAKAAWLPCLKRTSLLLPPFKKCWWYKGATSLFW